MTARAATVFALASLHCSTTAVLRAQTASPPDFSGVYFSIQPGFMAGRPVIANGQQTRPTQGSPKGDGSQGRSADVPSLTPEFMAKWEVIRKTRVAGSSEYDNFAKCLPVGMPSMMLVSGYPIEIIQNREKMVILGELNDSVRRIYLDGRKPTAKHLDDATYAGYSTGEWQGPTLVADTVALHPDSLIESITVVFTPHSDAMTVKERIRLSAPGILEDRMVVSDPKAFTKPWELVQTYRKAAQGRDELREFACAEGIATVK